MTDLAYRSTVGLAWRRSRTGAIAWGLVFTLMLIAVVATYSAAYSTTLERNQLFASFATSAGLKALLGPAHSLNTVGGFTAWRTMSFLPLIAAAWGLVAATGALRGEEESGRRATVLTGLVGRGRHTSATFMGLLAAGAVLLAITAAATLAAAVTNGGFDPWEGLFLALAICSAAPVFMAVGALTSQLAPTRRLASGLASAALAIAWVMRVASVSDSSLGWLRWATPLGWVEELRPMTRPQPWPLALIAVATVAIASLAVGLSARRDDGSALLQPATSRAPRPWLLGSALGLSLRERIGGLAGWAVGVGLAMLLYGALSKTVAELTKGVTGLQRQVREAWNTTANISTARGYLAILFVFLAIVVTMHAVSHSNAAAEEEREGRTSTVLSGPVSREAWFLGRVAVQILGIVLVCAVAAGAASLGAAAAGADVQFADMTKAAANMIPVAVLFGGVGFATFAFAPRHASGLAWTAIGLSYLWEQTGTVLKAPNWVLWPSPFHWVKAVPVVPAATTAAIVMLIIGMALFAVSVARFRARDLLSS